MSGMDKEHYGAAGSTAKEVQPDGCPYLPAPREEHLEMPGQARLGQAGKVLG